MSTSTRRKVPRFGPRTAGTLMTLEEFDSIASGRWKRGYRYELINGVLVVTPAAGIGQRGPNDVLGHWLFQYKETHPQGSQLDWTTHEHEIATRTSRRIADRVIWTGLGHMPDMEGDPPAIAIEFVSPGKRSRLRDYDVKRAECAEVGILEYWVIDRFRRQMTVYFLAGGHVPAQVCGEQEVYKSPLLPGFELSLAKLFAINDQIEAARRKKRPSK